MLKKTWGVVLLTLCSAVMGFAQEDWIHITAPANGEYLALNTPYTIRWSFGSFYNSSPGHPAHLSCGGQGIGDVPITTASFVWTVGKKTDGSFIPPGRYSIGIDCPVMDSSRDPIVYLVLAGLTLPPPSETLRLKRVPMEPMKFMLEPWQIKLDLAGIEYVELALLRGGKLLARLGKFAPGKPPTAAVALSLGAEELGLIRKMEPGFEIQVLTPQGKLLLKRAVRLAAD